MELLSVATLKRGLVLFWALWFTIVTLTNLFDALKALGVLDAGWSIASGNWEFMLFTTAIYATPLAVIAVLFTGVIIWEAVAAILFWRAFGDGLLARGPAIQAFVTGLALMATFVLADELFIAYEVEGTHLRLFTALTVSLLTIVLLPDRTEPIASA